MENYYFDSKKRFIIEDYHKAKTFSSFLPGIAGVEGVPIWAFYVNRGQGITSFGIQDKSNPIMEFYPANGAYQTVGTHGFRTFIKDVDAGSVYEPFGMDDEGTSRKMGIEKDSFFIQETNEEKGYSIHVKYTTLSNVPFGGLVRSTKVTNISGGKKVWEIIDGMPALLPYGVENAAYKEMSNLMQSWMEVFHTDRKIPFYKLRSSTKDEAVVSEVKAGYFYVNSSIENENVMTVYDPSVVFDYQTDLLKPVGFINSNALEMRQKNQVSANKVPAAFQLVSCELKSKESIELNSIIGYSDAYEMVDSFFDGRELSGFVEKQFVETKNEVEDICSDVETGSGITAFNEYMKQSYLDNVLRGGKPFLFEAQNGKHVYHIFSRKHGDLERDYNFFYLEPSKFSRGNGNYRDVNQNRRNDVIVNPEVEDFNIWMFYNLVQADGYNPLSIKGTSFDIDETSRQRLMDELTVLGIGYEDREKLESVIKDKFTPGILVNKLERHGITDRKVLMAVMKYATQHIDVDFGEGFWSDHFTYNLDLIKSYQYVYPDKMDDLLYGRKDYAYYNAPYYVLPRHEKYGITEGGKIRQYEATAKKPGFYSQWLKDEKGEVVKTNLFNKMLTLVLTKFMNLDAFGLGIEMEGERPGWNDALNGLPGLFGSGMSETVELLRCVRFLQEELSRKDRDEKTDVLEVTSNLMKSLKAILSDEPDAFERWDRVNEVKERYRQATVDWISGNETKVTFDEVSILMEQFAAILEKGVESALEIGNGLMPSYFINEVIEYEVIGGKTRFGLDSVKALAFKNRPLPFFLEGPARYLKTISGEKAKSLHEKVKGTDIYDPKIQMFKTSESIEAESMEIGRLRAFTPGWLERESVFLHMTYKYLLSMLESGLYDEFFKEIKTNFIPFLKPEVYGRPTTENSSFLASSVNPNPDVVGQGFVARLSGSTAEVISIWVKMFIGERGFNFENGELTFTFTPVLTSEFFDENHEASFKLFSSTKVTYVNPKGLDTFGPEGSKVSQIIVDGSEIEGTCLKGETAARLREGSIEEVRIILD